MAIDLLQRILFTLGRLSWPRAFPSRPLSLCW